MQRINFLAAIFIIFALMLLAPPDTTKAEWPTQSETRLHLSRSEESGLSFSRRYFHINGIKDQDALSSFAGQPAYWFEDLPWLGLASESSVLPTFEGSEERLDTSTDADTDFNPFSSFILFRYQSWRFEPFLGIGPTLITSELGIENRDSLNRMYLGFFYSF